MSYTCDTIWPMRIDLNSLECRQILREKELLCYSDVVSVLRAQGPLSEEKKTVLQNLQKILSISEERNKAELRRAANNEKLATIAENVSGFDAYSEWASLGALKFPPTKRPIPRTIYCDQASQTCISFTGKERDLPAPCDTNDCELSDKHEAAILTNRIINKDRRTVKTEATIKSQCSMSTMTELNNKITPNQELFKNNPTKEPKNNNTSHDYNLHLLSEIATGESNQSEAIVNDQIVVETNIKPDSFSIHNQINDIEQGGIITTGTVETVAVITTAAAASTTTMINTRQTLASSLLMPPNNNNNHPPNLIFSGPIKSLNTTNIQEINLSASNNQMIISNNAGQRFAFPRNTITQSINLISSNSQKNQISSFISHQHQHQSQATGGSFITLSNNQLRSPPAHNLGGINVGGGGSGGGSSWTGGQQTQSAQQVFIQNVPNIHHGSSSSSLSLSANMQQHSTGDYANSLGLALKQRAMTEHKTHQQPHQVNNKLVVRNLGTQVAAESDRNKRFMVVKGNAGSGSVGPSNKKPKISNPSNRQPGRPPLMPAPSSAYTSRPYVANEIFHSNRAINTISSISDTSTTDSNGLKISSISSGSRGVNVNSSQIRSNSYYPVNRGNGLQRTNTSTSSVVQLGSGSQILTVDSSSNVTTNTLRPKNIQPVISVVPLSPRGLTTTDSVISNVSILGNSNKDDSEHNIMDKDSNSFKVTSKDEVYANLLERINQPPMVSLSQTENKIQ